MQGEYSQARNHFRRALTIYREHSLPSNTNRARVLRNIGWLANWLGQYRAGYRLGRQALLVFDQELQQNHIATAQAITNIRGESLVLYGHYEQSLEYHQQA